MSEIIKEEILNYFKHYTDGNLEDLIRYLTRIIENREEIQLSIWDIEDITKEILKNLHEKNTIYWDQDTEKLQLLDKTILYPESEIESLKRENFKYFCIADGSIKNRRGLNLNLKIFDEKIEESPEIKLGTLNKKGEADYEMEYTWNFEDINIRIAIKPTYFHLESIPTYLILDNPFKKFIMKEDRKILEKVPGESGVYFFLIILSKILKNIDINFYLELSSFSDYEFL